MARTAQRVQPSAALDPVEAIRRMMAAVPGMLVDPRAPIKASCVFTIPTDECIIFGCSPHSGVVESTDAGLLAGSAFAEAVKQLFRGWSGPQAQVKSWADDTGRHPGWIGTTTEGGRRRRGIRGALAALQGLEGAADGRVEYYFKVCDPNGYGISKPMFKPGIEPKWARGSRYWFVFDQG